MRRRTTPRILRDNALIITVKSDNTGVSASNQFLIKTKAFPVAYNYRVVTSDGQTITGNTGDLTITFPLADTYTIQIIGIFPAFDFDLAGDRLKILELSQFGNYALNGNDQRNAFRGCNNLVVTATDIGFFENTVQFSRFFEGCNSIITFPTIDTSSVDSIALSFYQMSGLTSFPLLDFVSVLDAGQAFDGCTSLTSFPLVNLSNCFTVELAWARCSGLTSFPLLNLSSATNVSQAWISCSGLLTFPLIDFSNAQDFSSAWRQCSSLSSFPLIDVSSATSFNSTWRECTGLTSFPLLVLPVTLTDVRNAWLSCTSLTTFPLMDFSNVTRFDFAWFDTAITNFPLIDTSNGTHFNTTWFSCDSIVTFPALNFTNSVTFNACWDNCSTMANFPSNMFDLCSATIFTDAFKGTNLTQTSIDGILVSIESNGTSNGTFNQSGGSAPSATGETAIDDLRTRGWTITVTGGY